MYLNVCDYYETFFYLYPYKMCLLCRVETGEKVKQQFQQVILLSVHSRRIRMGGRHTNVDWLGKLVGGIHREENVARTSLRQCTSD